VRGGGGAKTKGVCRSADLGGSRGGEKKQHVFLLYQCLGERLKRSRLFTEPAHTRGILGRKRFEGGTVPGEKNKAALPTPKSDGIRTPTEAKKKGARTSSLKS